MQLNSQPIFMPVCVGCLEPLLSGAYPTFSEQCSETARNTTLESRGISVLANLVTSSA